LIFDNFNNLHSDPFAPRVGMGGRARDLKLALQIQEEKSWINIILPITPQAFTLDETALPGGKTS